ncbi:ethylene induced calmodulin binding protein [Striga asiatica]|uniref:Ethylene induced calmodulin binding protein n=1 Tax=Striga asiatica TaxID=4170 RepID=A0A5A7RI00_STRAF|nr:ethylene induced calmodulin binding protein [Striga asiatica]
MPGPGPHMIYALGSGQGLMHVSNGRFGPHHCVTYAVNAFFGPDIGSFSEWLTSTLGLGRVFGSSVETWIHDPFYYALILGFPLALLYSWVSRIMVQKGVLDSFSGENGHSSMYTWILSTGWWKTRAPIDPDAVLGEALEIG